MNTEKDDNLDKLFKKGLADPVDEPAFRDADWDAMEQMLDQGKKRSAIIYWLPVLGSAAALLILFLGYLFLKTDVLGPVKKGQLAAIHPANSQSIAGVKSNTGKSGEPGRKAADSGKQQTKSAHYATTTPARQGRAGNGGSFFSLSTGKARRNVTGKVDDQAGQLAGNVVSAASSTKTQPAPANNNAGSQAAALAGIKSQGSGDGTQLGTADDQKQLGKADVKADQKGNILADNTQAGAAGDKTQPSAADAKNTPGPRASDLSVKSAGRQKTGYRPVFALGVIASSDLNGVNSPFQQSKVGGNFGAIFSLTFAKKWTISTGAQYDVKPYLTNFNNYHTAYQFSTQPSSVNADCRMLDIPLNINYQVYRQHANTITIGTGLSSYFMLREDYQFNYADPYTTGPQHFTVINQNRNILSVLNFDATYTHQINSKFGLTVQPYTKVPLTNVGYSQVKLQSTGMAFGINWNINASTKPK